MKTSKWSSGPKRLVRPDKGPFFLEELKKSSGPKILVKGLLVLKDLEVFWPWKLRKRSYGSRRPVKHLFDLEEF